MTEVKNKAEPLWKTVWRFLKKLNIELSDDTTLPLLSIYPKHVKAGTQKYTHIPMFTAALFTTAKR